MSTNPSSNPRFELHYEQGMLRSSFKSLFWVIISERKRLGKFSLGALVSLLPRGDKSKVSRWFNGDPNWTINTMGTLAHVLDVDLQIQAVDRKTGLIYTPTGVQSSDITKETSSVSPIIMVSRPLGRFETQQFSPPPKTSSVDSARRAA